MRLGGPVFFKDTKDAVGWMNAARDAGYRAVVSPLDENSDSGLIREYVEEARRHDIIIAEVGAWSNPISPDREVREKAMGFCKKRLALADKLGARVCVNIAGSRGQQWDGPDKENFAEETFDLIVKSVQEIIDAVQPTRTHYALEMMPWVFPDSASTYLELVEAVDREQFAVHYDPVNIVTSPRDFYRTGEMMKEFFEKLGPNVKTCHAKDIQLAGKLTVHLDEVLPGTGGLDYEVFLTELEKLDKDTPIIIEHLSSEEEYRQAATNIRKMAAELGVGL